MADEITISVSMHVNKGGVVASRVESFTADMAGNSVNHGVQSIATGGEAFEHTDLAAEGTIGWAFVKNLDDTNFVTIGTHATSNHTIKLLPGESALFRADGNLSGQADTSAVDVEWYVIEV